jgi:hypothetical protein
MKEACLSFLLHPSFFILSIPSISLLDHRAGTAPARIVEEVQEDI